MGCVVPQCTCHHVKGQLTRPVLPDCSRFMYTLAMYRAGQDFLRVRVLRILRGWHASLDTLRHLPQQSRELGRVRCLLPMLRCCAWCYSRELKYDSMSYAA